VSERCRRGEQEAGLQQILFDILSSSAYQVGAEILHKHRGQLSHILKEEKIINTPHEKYFYEYRYVTLTGCQV
jgi:hypothetical protein